MAASEAEEQATRTPVSSSEGIEPPVHHADRPSWCGPEEEPFGRTAELGAVPCRDPQVPGPDEGLRLSPRSKEAPHLGARVPPGPLGVARDRDHPGRASAHRPGAGQSAREPQGPQRTFAVPVAGSARPTYFPSQQRRERASSRHHRPLPRAERSQLLARRSSHARVVLRTDSENPVSRWSTAPSLHSRKTCGIR